MEESPEMVKEFIHTELRPRIRVDGGDILFTGFSGDTVSIEARGQCASCPAMCDGLSWWIERKLTERFGRSLKLSVSRRKNYFE